jgi:hypothetical protein
MVQSLSSPSASQEILEEWVIPVRLTKKVLNGAYPFEQKFIMVTIGLTWFAAAFIANYIGLKWFPAQFDYSFASASFFVNVALLIVFGFSFMITASSGITDQESNRFDSIENFARDELGPWLEAQGVQNSFFVAYNTLMHGHAELDADQTPWGATKLSVWLDGKTTKLTLWK